MTSDREFTFKTEKLSGEKDSLVVDSRKQLASSTNLSITSTGSLTPDSSANAIAETGRISVTDTIDGGSTETVNFQSSYNDPVVVTYIPSRAEGQAVAARVKNVTQTSCELFLHEPDAGSIHATETISYLVAEQGSWTTANGYHIEAGSLDTSDYHHGDEGDGIREEPAGPTVSFGSSFSAEPVVFSSLNTYNNGDFATTINHNIGTSSFQVEQEIAEAQSSVTTETIGWFSIERNSGEFSTGSAWKADTNSDGDKDSVKEAPTTLPYSQANFSSQPDILSSLQTLDGPDGAWARGAESEWTSSEAYVYAEEDQVTDTERSHVNEEFAYFVVEPDTLIKKTN